MALTVDPSHGNEGLEDSTRITVAEGFAPVPFPRSQQQSLPNRRVGVRDNQTARASSSSNDNDRTPVVTRQSYQGGERTGVWASSLLNPVNLVNARQKRQPRDQPLAEPQTRNQGAGRPDTNSDDSAALNPDTERLTGIRGALRKRARSLRSLRRTRITRDVDAQQRGDDQPQSPPDPTPFPSLAAPLPSDTPPFGVSRPTSPLAGITTRAPTLPVIVDTSDTSSSEDDSEDEAASVQDIFEGYTQPACEKFSSHLPTDHQDYSQTEPRPRRGTSSPCLICLDVPNEFPHHRPTSSCTHAPTVCASCLKQYISHAVRSEGLTTLTCPDPECRESMERADVVRGARKDRACLDRYEALLRLRSLEKESNFVRCKNPTCNWGQIHERGAAIPIVICQVCRARSCFTHDVPWHTGVTCEQYTNAQRAKQEAEKQANQAYVDQHAKVCPNPTCGRWIEKSEGCDHITCRSPGGCGHEFCWSCLADYRIIFQEGSQHHASNCRHHVDQEGQHAPPILVDIHPPPRNRPRLLSLRRTVRPDPAAPSQPWWGRLFGRARNGT